MRSGLLQAVGFIIVFSCFTFTGGAQETAKPSGIRPIGTVAAIDTNSRRIVLKTDSGVDITVVYKAETPFLRVAPGEKDLRKASKIDPAELQVGDRILARGPLAPDQKSMTALAIVVMTKADIAHKLAVDRAEWEKRGIAGTIRAIDPVAKTITVVLRGLGEPKTITVTPAEGAVFRRYAPDSVKFSDAKPSRFEDLKVGDEVKALGNKSPDGASFTAEMLVSGSFRTMTATVKAINAADNTVAVTDLSTNKLVLVCVNSDSNLKRLPEFVAGMLARKISGTSNGDGGQTSRGFMGAAKASNAAGSLPGAQHRPPDFQAMLENLPGFKLSDLKPGDAVIVASTNGSDPTKVTAITILAGVEPLFAAAARSGHGMNFGSWDLDMNMNMSVGMP